MNALYSTHALESILRGADFRAKFDGFCRTVSPRFRGFRSNFYAKDGTGYDHIMSNAHRDFFDFFDGVIEQYLIEMNISEEVLLAATAKNMESGDLSAERLFEQFKTYEDFERFGMMMEDKYNELFGNKGQDISSTSSSKDTSSSSSSNTNHSIHDGSKSSLPVTAVAAAGATAPGKRFRSVRVLWDIENIAAMQTQPHHGGVNPTMTILNNFLRTRGWMGQHIDTLISAFCNPRELQTKGNILDELDKSNVEIIRAAQKREDSDRKLSQRLHRDMESLASDSTTFILISSDQDFRNDIQVAVSRGYEVVVIHNAPSGSKQAQTLSMFASQAYHWIDDVGMCVTESSGGSSNSTTASASKTLQGPSGSQSRSSKDESMPAAGDDQDLDFSPIIGWQSGRIFRWHGVFGFADAMDANEKIFGSDCKDPSIRKRWRVHFSQKIIPIKGYVPKKGDRVRLLVAIEGKGPHATEIEFPDN